MAFSLLDPFWLPEVEPAQPAEPPDDLVEFRAASNAHILVEIFRRPSNTLGFRYRAWVAWRDAGGMVRSHSWHEVQPDEGLLTDDLNVARQTAERHAEAHGIRFEGAWQRPT